jgi:hypothetical protein
MTSAALTPTRLRSSRSATSRLSAVRKSVKKIVSCEIIIHCRLEIDTEIPTGEVVREFVASLDYCIASRTPEVRLLTTDISDCKVTGDQNG